MRVRSNIVWCSCCGEVEIDVTDRCDLVNCTDHWCLECMTENFMPTVVRRAQDTLTGPRIERLFG